MKCIFLYEYQFNYFISGLSCDIPIFMGQQNLPCLRSGFGVAFPNIFSQICYWNISYRSSAEVRFSQVNITMNSINMYRNLSTKHANIVLGIGILLQHLTISRFFRVVPAKQFLQSFASDRRHMKRPDGSWIKPPPPYPAICTSSKHKIIFKWIWSYIKWIDSASFIQIIILAFLIFFGSYSLAKGQ